ncbi:Hsp33 family molecular chaperone HslO [Pseudohalioglobus sediminis]|uniref:Hsp33 family molecular chaperone HslO n=1 Tax=Pseudohalioglobus sediminis TaxID=2606449 RepID=A0A5B0WMY6_9GAMM|nr:Hsp33 family molecular chaperone HslO [Pseudohalioglobus sediminis]KAA1187957.1 Hsp33 family molecular chaperone HslO [Pseudohalioglobus sediminis]
MTETAPADRNRTQRFLFEEADIRGEIVQLGGAYREIVEIHQYAPGVSRLLGEFMAAAVLLATTLKFEGKLVLQARSQGQVPLIMAECDHRLRIRAIARGAQEATAERFDQLLAGGQLAITIDPTRGQRYQGVVPLAEQSLAHSLDAYFRQSEQLGSRFWLAADGQQAAGMLLQQLPAQLEQDNTLRARQWEHACTLAATLQTAELLQLGAADIAHRLYHEDPLRLFEPVSVTFECNCSRERTLNALASLPAAEIRELLEELGSVTMDCEFCNQQYRFDEADLSGFMQPDSPDRLH